VTGEPGSGGASASERHAREVALFEAALALTGPARDAFLAAECAGDDALRDRVERLLAAEPIAALQTPDAVLAAGREALGGSEATSLPKRIGDYRIVRELGRGGMGVVFEAEQERPRRRVAVKRVRPGFATPETLRRFEHEAQVLGWLSHPGVAQIFAAGTSDSGAGPQPWFAMELVDGRPLTRWAREDGIELRERLAVFAAVCDAVHHAHQKGVIHRDLKPANILITRDGRPKVLDFGVARVAGDEGRTLATALATNPGQLLGTLAYMSPEQLAGDPSRLDVRSDVYSLGVVLYELLTGRLPVDVAEVPLPEVARRVAEDEPDSVSTHDARLRGDVETIVAKAIAKEPERRYASAEELASDVRRFLAGEPISARPASRLYQLSRFSRRNKALVGGVIVALVALSIGTVASTVLWLRAEGARDDAVDAERVANTERAAALDAREVAERARAEAEASAVRATAEAQSAAQVKDFLVGLFQAANPDHATAGSAASGAPGASGASAEPPTVRELLDRGAGDLVAGLDYAPMVQVELLFTVANAYAALYATRPQIEMLEAADRVLAETDAPEGDVLRVRVASQLGDAYGLAGDLETSLAAHERAHAFARERFGDGHALELLARNQRARSLFRLGRIDEAHAEVDAVAEALAAGGFAGEEALWVAQFLDAHRGLRAAIATRVGDQATAIEVSRAVVADLEAAGRGDDPSALGALVNLADLLSNSDDGVAEANELFERIRAVAARQLSSPNLYEFTVAYGLGANAIRTGDLELAEEHLTAAVAFDAEIVPHELKLHAHRAHAYALLVTKRFDAALEHYLIALDLQEAIAPLEHPLRATLLDDVRTMLTTIAQLPADGGPPAWEGLLATAVAWMEERGHAADADELGSAVRAAAGR